MASKPLRPCNHAGCGVLTRDGWCDKHKPREQRKASAGYHGWYMLPIWTDRQSLHTRRFRSSTMTLSTP